MTSDRLLDNFYSLRSVEKLGNNDLVVYIRLNPDHAIYKGHFPEQPIVPGVCMLQMIKESLEFLSCCTLQYTEIASCKFLSAVHPIETSTLELSIKWEETAEGIFKLQSKGVCNGTEFIKVKASLIKK